MRRQQYSLVDDKWVCHNTHHVVIFFNQDAALSVCEIRDGAQGTVIDSHASQQAVSMLSASAAGDKDGNPWCHITGPLLTVKVPYGQVSGDLESQRGNGLVQISCCYDRADIDERNEPITLRHKLQQTAEGRTQLPTYVVSDCVRLCVCCPCFICICCTSCFVSHYKPMKVIS